MISAYIIIKIINGHGERDRQAPHGERERQAPHGERDSPTRGERDRLHTGRK
jgi:hypothetical protein